MEDVYRARASIAVAGNPRCRMGVTVVNLCAVVDGRRWECRSRCCPHHCCGLVSCFSLFGREVKRQEDIRIRFQYLTCFRLRVASGAFAYTLRPRRRSAEPPNFRVAWGFGNPAAGAGAARCGSSTKMVDVFRLFPSVSTLEAVPITALGNTPRRDP